MAILNSTGTTNGIAQHPADLDVSLSQKSSPLFVTYRETLICYRPL